VKSDGSPEARIVAEARVVSAGLRGLAVQSFGRVIRFIYELILSRALGAAGYGSFAVVTSVFDLGRAVSYFGLDHALARSVAIADARGDRGTVPHVTQVAVTIALLLAGVAAAALAVAAPRIADALGTPVPGGIRLAGLALIPNAALIMMSAVARARGRVALERALQAVLQPAVVALIVGLSVVITHSLSVAFGAFAMSQVLCAVVAVLAVRPRLWQARGGGTGPWRHVALAMLTMAVPMGAATLAQVILIEGPRLIVAAVQDPVAVGAYTVGSRLSAQLGLVFVGFDSLMGPVIARLHHEGRRSELEIAVRRATEWVAALTLAVGLALLVRPSALVRLFGSGYQAGAEVLTVLVVAQLLFVVGGPASRLLPMSGHAGIDLVITVVAAATAVILATLLTPRFGAAGAAGGTAVGMLVLRGLQVAWAWRKLAVWAFGVRTIQAVVAAGVGLVASLPDAWGGFGASAVVALLAYAIAMMALTRMGPTQVWPRLRRAMER